MHSPAGLDVGAEGPQEIAWAIAGEVMAVRSGRVAGFLKDRPGPIHGAPQQVDEFLDDVLPPVLRRIETAAPATATAEVQV